MAVRKTAPKDTPETTETPSDPVEEKLIEFAKQVGFFVGTVQAKADGWLDRKALSKTVGRIRDSAAELLDHVNREAAVQRNRAAKQPPTPSAPARPSRGSVDAPGKHHRKPPPQERVDKRMGEPIGNQMGQKSVKNRMRSGRG